MVFESSYPFLGVLESMIIFFAFFIWIWLLFVVFADIFRRRDISGWGKALWIIALIILPYLGVLIYLIVEHNGMADRSEKQARQAQTQFDDYVRQAAGSAGGGSAAEIAKAKELLDSGAISQDEFEALKRKALAT